MSKPWDEPDEAIMPFDPPYELECPRCAGPMLALLMRHDRLVLLECTGECRRAWQCKVRP